MGGKLIALAGMIGVGKSTYAGMIGERLGSVVEYESVEDNPFLERFYRDQARWSFSLQIYFLNTRFRVIKKALTNRNMVIDRSLYEDLLFAEVNRDMGLMTDFEFECYRDLLMNMMEELKEFEYKAPDVLVYLRTDFETALSRMRKRSRDFELDPGTLEYFKLLHSRYDDFILNRYEESPVLVIEANTYDVLVESDREDVLQLIEEYLNNLDCEVA